MLPIAQTRSVKEALRLLGHDLEVWDLARRVARISVRPTLTCAQAALAETMGGDNNMEYRGVRYELRRALGQNEWVWTVYTPEPKNGQVAGDRTYATRASQASHRYVVSARTGAGRAGPAAAEFGRGQPRLSARSTFLRLGPAFLTAFFTLPLPVFFASYWTS
jgi:hypothetical protein